MRCGWEFFTFGVVVTKDAWAVTFQLAITVDVLNLRVDSMLRRAYTMLHPGLYRYNTQVEIDAAFNALECWCR